MKKVFVIAALAASLICLSSCDKNKEKCWELTGTAQKGSASVEVSGMYVWCSQNDVEASVAEEEKAFKALGADVTLKYKSTSKYKTANDCTAQNKNIAEILLGL